MKIEYVIVAFALSLLTGCVSNEKRNVLTAQNIHQQIVGFQNGQIKEHIHRLPDWVLAPPQADEIGVYAVGIGESNTFQIAVKKAKLEAEFELRKLFAQEIAGSEQMSTANEHGTSVSRYRGLISKLVSEGLVIGYSIEKQEVMAKNGKYHAYVLLKLPYDEFNIVQNQRNLSEHIHEFAPAFSDLEKRLDKRRDEYLE